MVWKIVTEGIRSGLNAGTKLSLTDGLDIRDGTFGQEGSQAGKEGLCV